MSEGCKGEGTYKKTSAVAKYGLRPQVDQVVNPLCTSHVCEVGPNRKDNVTIIVKRRDSPH